MKVYCHSRLIAGKVRGEFEAKDSRMQWYLTQVKHLLDSFNSFTLEQVHQSKNSHADSLATLATLIGEGLMSIILVEKLVTLAYEKQTPVDVNYTRVSLSWMDLIVLFLKNRTFLEDRTFSRKPTKKRPSTSFTKSRSCTNTSIQDHTCCVFTLRQLKHYWKSFMREFVIVIRGVGPYHTEL